MTDYHLLRLRPGQARYPAWKRKQIEKKWQSFFGLFLVLFLTVAIVNGLLKSFSTGTKVDTVSWDSEGALVVGLNTNPPSLLIFNSESRKIVLVPFADNLNFVVQGWDKPVRQLSDVIIGGDGAKLTYALAVLAGVPVNHYIIFKNPPDADVDLLQEYFGSFASLSTPFRILTSENLNSVKDTNLAQKDLLRLWWQSKSFRVSDPKILDSNIFTEEIVLSLDQRVLGIDVVSLTTALKKYLENKRFVEANESITISNAAGVVGAGKLAAGFISAIGGQVEKIEVNDSELEKSQIISNVSDNYTASYLAIIFDCDINAVSDVENGEIIVRIGRDFAQKYLEVN